MILVRALTSALLLSLVLPVGCAKPTTKAAQSETMSAAKIRDLRKQRRRDRARLRELEEKMAKLASQQHDEAPALPVERLGPEPDPVESEAEQAMVVGVADDGTEIVYVGEAAQKSSVRADTQLLRESVSRPAPRRATPRRVTAKATPRPLPPAPVAQSGDSLGVTSRRLPKVAEVTKQAPPAPRARQAAPTVRRPRRPGNAPATAVSEYQKHVTALKAGKHEEAIKGFRHFVRRYARSDYADNAQYWLGEAYYDRKMFKEALVEFERVSTTYPTGNKVADARLKAAFCKINLGDTAAARARLTALVEDFPGSRIAQLASEKLERLSK